MCIPSHLSIERQRSSPRSDSLYIVDSAPRRLLVGGLNKTHVIVVYIPHTSNIILRTVSCSETLIAEGSGSKQSRPGIEKSVKPKNTMWRTIGPRERLGFRSMLRTNKREESFPSLVYSTVRSHMVTQTRSKVIPAPRGTTDGAPPLKHACSLLPRAMHKQTLDRTTLK